MDGLKHQYSKTRILHAIAEMVETNPESLRREYYRHSFNHRTGLEILNPAVIEEIYDDCDPDYVYDQVVAILQEEESVHDAVAESMEVYDEETVSSLCYKRAKQALYDLAAGRKADAMNALVFIMESLDGR